MTNALRVLALIAVVAISAVLLFRGKLSSIYAQKHSSPALPVSNETSGGRRVLYWYDAMNPQHTYNKPGKAPDGMDLMPKYADEGTSAASTGQNSMPANPAERKILYWYDPMHPAYRSDKPGIAPDCGMQLVPKYADNTKTASLPAGTVNISADRQQLMNVRTAIVQRQPLTREIRTTAQIVADETKISHVHVKVSGYIEKTYADFIGQLIKKGQPLFTLYSPDLVSAEEEYLIAKRGEKILDSAPYLEVSQGAQSLLHSARERLRLWDISEAQIKKLDETGEVEKTMTFYSPATGFVTDRKAFPQTSVTPDLELYTMTDLSTVWAMIDIYEYEVPYVHIGQQVNLSLPYYPGKTFGGRISYLYPTVDPQTRTVKARVNVANPHFELKPQMFADAQIEVNYGTKIIVPQEAVLNSGAEQTVFVVHDGSMFEPRTVTVGPVMDGNAVILTGLKTGETIVTSGNFLIDSESSLKSATSEMKH